MGVYDGDTVRITVTVLDFNGNPVTTADTATVSLYDSAGNYVFLNEDLTYSSEYAYWYYDWQDALPGSFVPLATFTGGSYDVFEYGKIKVSPLKLTPTGNPTPITH